jgi:hypothetical protein
MRAEGRRVAGYYSGIGKDGQVEKLEINERNDVMQKEIQQSRGFFRFLPFAIPGPVRYDS